MKKIIPLIAIVLLSGCVTQTEPMAQSESSSSSAPYIRGVALYEPGKEMDQVMLGAEIVDTPEQREKGMMFRTDFGDAQGMLFFFDEEQPLSFWMKNTLIPLDVLFFDDEATFVSFSTMVPCESDPCPIYSSEEPAMSALEVPAGFVKKHGIGKGWKIRLME